MSLNYANALSSYINKGKCGQPEKYDNEEELKSKCKELVDIIDKSNIIVVITGAGISTSCGIPDFRGPNGVWTLEQKGLSPNTSISFELAKPSYSHMCLVELEKRGKLNFLISQNVDGLHHRSGFPLNKLAELHGNMFMKKCHSCQTKYLSGKCVNTIGLKATGEKCTKIKQRGHCRGELHDTILDWEDSLPNEELELSGFNCKTADLCLCLGTSLQIMPCGNFPLNTKKNGGKIVIINLQETRMDKHADLVIHYKLDDVFKLLFDYMSINNDELKLSKNSFIILKSTSKNTLVNDKLKLLNVDNLIIQTDREFDNDEKTQIVEYKNDIKLEETSDEPDLILIFSGKRKSGKDFSCAKLFEKLTNNYVNYHVETLTLSAPLKQAYAEEHNLDFKQLLDTSDYKEKYRIDMIKWGEEKRNSDPSFFCRISVNNVKNKIRNIQNKFLIWIVTDARRHTDLNFFKENYPNQVKLIRVIANDEVRKERNWSFVEGVDDAASECDLDDVSNWDFKILNNNKNEFESSFGELVEFIERVYNTIKK